MTMQPPLSTQSFLVREGFFALGIAIDHGGVA
jgi:hypothetical protein